MAAIHHTPMPEEFSMRANTEDGWELSIVITRGRPFEDDPSVDTFSVVVSAHLWQVSRFRRRQSVVASAGIDLAWNDCGRLREDLSWAVTELDMIGLGKARAFLHANYKRLDAIVQLDDQIRSGACRCDSCRYGVEWRDYVLLDPKAEQS